MGSPEPRTDSIPNATTDDERAYNRGWQDGNASALDACNPIIERLQTALRVAAHSPHDQAGEPVEGFPVCSVCGAIQTEADAPSPVTGEAELRARFRSRLAADPGLADTGRILARFDEAVCDGSCGPEHSTTHLFDHPSPSKQDSVPEPVTEPPFGRDVAWAGPLAGRLQAAMDRAYAEGGAEGPIDGWAKCSKCPWSVTGASSMMEAAGWLKEHQVSHGSPAPQAPADSLDALGLSDEQTAILRHHLSSRQQTLGEWLGDVLMEYGMGRATGKDYPPPNAARLDSQGSAQGRES